MWNPRRGLALLLLLVAACSGAEAPAGGAARRTSILFVSIDTLAAGHTSLHGYARDTTPHLAELARESVVFERCLANAPFTTPSYISQFTGLAPGASWSDPDEFRKRFGRGPETIETWNLPAARTTLAEQFRAAGYRTAAFIDNPMCGAAFGLDQGFELFDTSAAEIEAHLPDGGIAHQLPLVLDWLDQRKPDEPFFLFMNVFDVHEPYQPPPTTAGRFGADELARAGRMYPIGRGGRFGTIPDKSARLVVPEGLLPAEMSGAPIVARYDEEVAAVDAALGTLFDALRARGLWDELLVVFSADHGEAMDGPEYKFGHGTHVEEVLHVPLVFKLPGAAGAGRRVAQSVQLVDLAPTLLELGGLALPPDLQGRSLRPLLAGGTLAPLAIVHEGGRQHSRAVTDGRWRLVVTHPGRDVNAILTSVRGRAWLGQHHPELVELMTSSLKLTEMVKQRPEVRAVVVAAHAALDGPYFELYDVQQDPEQLVDRAAEQPEIVARLRARYEQAEAEAEAERARVPVGEARAAADLEQLQSLGYAGEEE